MVYHEAVNRLERLRRLRPKLGTETTAAMLAHLGDPHEGVTHVQVAGSNGKGSTARILERILEEAGLEVGLYTSPDLNGLRERIRVGTRRVPRRDVARFVEKIDPYVVDRSVEGDTPTFFEALTAMALWHFGTEDVDVAILEVGIGGRYDATSVVDPAAAAVTSVSLEHTDIIGSTVEEIAADKASVAPGGRPLVTGATGPALETIRGLTDVVTVGDEPAETSSREASTDDAPPGDGDHAVDVVARETGMATATESTVSIVGSDWELETESPLLGPHQAINAGIAATLAKQVANVDEEAISAGIRNVHWPGRFEVMETEPLVALDGAHNPAACGTLTSLVERFEFDDLVLVFGAMRDKDHAAMVRALPSIDRVFVAEPDADRAQDAATLAAVFDRETDARVDPVESVAHAVGQALAACDPGDAVLITGSLYVVGEARDRWTRSPAVVGTDGPARVRTVLREADVPAAQREDLVGRTVTRTVRFRARPDVATELERRMLSLGGTAGVSGIEAPDQRVAVVLTGTTDQFVDLIRSLRDHDGELGHVATQLDGVFGGGNRGGTPWSDGTAVMGILNVTPDSFHDGGEHDDVDAAVERAREMVAAGADVIDVGGESTRPGAETVSAEVERDRVLPVLERIADLDAAISIDTRKPSVAAAAVDAGVDVVNDVTGLADATMRRVVAGADVSAVLMHSLSAPVAPDRAYPAEDVVGAVLDDLTERLLLAERAGIDRSRLIVDPGLGFGKDAAGSFTLLDRLEEFRALGTPVMVGHSHKSMFAGVAGEADDRLAPTVAATALAAERGADLVRVHDVAPNAAAIRTARRTIDD